MTMKNHQFAPTAYLIAGPNGAGKTTFATEFLPAGVKCRQFLNADLIAAGLSPFSPETQNIRAGRLLIERARELSARRIDFGFETTLSGRTYAHFLDRLRLSGYRIELFFLWLPTVEMALDRVHNRVQQGGHDVPAEDVIRRYHAGIRNLFQLYRHRLDSLWLYDAECFPPRLFASEIDGRTHIQQQSLMTRFERQSKETHDTDE